MIKYNIIILIVLLNDINTILLCKKKISYQFEIKKFFAGNIRVESITINQRVCPLLDVNNTHTYNFIHI